MIYTTPAQHDKLLVFDVDGTLIDSHPGYSAALQEFSETRNLPYSDEKMRAGYTNPLQYDLGWGLPLAEQPPVLQDLNDFYSSEMRSTRRFMPTLFPHVIETLEKLTHDYDLAIVTARDRASLFDVFDHYTMSHFFIGYRSLCCAKDRAYPIKPEPDSLLCLLRETGHEVTDTIMFGDTTADLGLANNTGAYSVAVLWGYHDKARLQACSPTLTANSFDELPAKAAQIFSARRP